MRVIEKVFKGLMMLVMVAAVSVLLGFVVEHLWNWLMPGIFGVRTITYWQAVGLFFLSKLLLGGFPRGGGRGRGDRGWKRRMEKRWTGMSEEEREKLRAGMRGGMRGRYGCDWGREDNERFREEMRSRWGYGPPRRPRGAGEDEASAKERV
jgi:hypothetical protein